MNLRTALGLAAVAVLVLTANALWTDNVNSETGEPVQVCYEGGSVTYIGDTEIATNPSSC